MTQNPWYIIGGFLVFTLLGLLLVSAYTYGFLGILKLKIKKIWLPLAIITVSWLLASMIPVMFFSGFGLWIFSAIMMAQFLATGFLAGYKLLKLSVPQAIFYSIGFSVIINPVWYFLFT